MIRADDLVCNVITNHPEAFTVFERLECVRIARWIPPVSICISRTSIVKVIEDFAELNEQVLRK